MRRRTEIAQSSVQGACNALRAARDAAREAQTVAAALSIAPAEAQAIRNAASLHLCQVEKALVELQAAVDCAATLRNIVDHTETSHLGVPILPPAASRG